MTPPVRVLVFGEASSVGRVEAALPPANWACVTAALPGTGRETSALETGEIAVLCQSAHLALETCRSLGPFLDDAGDLPLIVVLPDGEAGYAADVMRAGARDCVTED